MRFVPNSQLDFLRGVYEAWNAAGPSAPEAIASDYFHPDIEFVEAEAIPGAGTYRGRDAVAALLRDRFDVLTTVRMENVELQAVDDERVFASMRARGRGAGSGADVSVPLWHLLTIEDEWIVRIEEFVDEAAARAAAQRR
jgi:ketosteroid isomerase-like protein